MNANSALYWLPRIEAAGLPVPKTVVVPYDHQKVLLGMYGESEVGPPIQEVLSAAKPLGDVVFIRGDQTSSKHSGPGGYRFRTAEAEKLARLLCWNVEDAEGKLMFEDCQEAFLVRKWLDLETSFGAFGYGPEGSEPHPIAREWRFFADRDGVICHQPYWPARAIDGQTTEADWEAKLRHLNRDLSPAEEELLSGMAVAAATACPLAKSWSVDFACDTSGKWWLIDMAVAAASYHYEDCPHREDPRILGPRSPHVSGTKRGLDNPNLAEDLGF